MSATNPASQMASILDTVKDLETRITSLRKLIDGGVVGAVAAPEGKKRGRPSKAAIAAAAAAPPAEPKPKKEMSDGVKAWLEFNARIAEVLTREGSPFKRVAEAKQFASKLKKLKDPAEWSDEEILEEREQWADEHQVPCPVCKKNPTEDVTEHKACILALTEQAVAAGKSPEEAVNEWAKAVGAAVPAEAAPAEKKSPGRPKKTDEQKAADKVAREAAAAALTPEQKAAAKAAKAAKKAAKAAGGSAADA
jgi:hypothetical protein